MKNYSIALIFTFISPLASCFTSVYVRVLQSERLGADGAPRRRGRIQGGVQPAQTGGDVPVQAGGVVASSARYGRSFKILHSYLSNHILATRFKIGSRRHLALWFLSPEIWLPHFPPSESRQSNFELWKCDRILSMTRFRRSGNDFFMPLEYLEGGICKDS